MHLVSLIGLAAVLTSIFFFRRKLDTVRRRRARTQALIGTGVLAVILGLSLARIAPVGAWPQHEYGNPSVGGFSIVGNNVVLVGGEYTITSQPITTQSAGSTVLVLRAGPSDPNNAPKDIPSDNYGNTYTLIGTHQNLPFWEGWVSVYACAHAAGGPGFIVTMNAIVSGEKTLAVVEVENGGVLIPEWTFGTTVQLYQTSANVTTTGPSVLVALWAGEAGTPSLAATVAVPTTMVLLRARAFKVLVQ
jgi:hypothetical protein